MNTPNIRFKGFGGDWEQRKFEEIFSVSQGLQIPISDRFTEDGDNRYFYITNEFLKANCAEAYYIESPSEAVICDEDDILMTRTGNTGIVVTDVKGCFHNNFFKIKYDKEAFSKRFICYLLSSPMMQKVILNRAGSSTIPDLSHKNFYKIKAFFPSAKDEQDNVGEFLYHLDNLITLHQRKCDSLKQVKKYMLQKMFPKQGEKVPEIRFAGFTGDWEQRKFGDFAKRQSETRMSNSDFPCVEYEDIIAGHGVLNKDLRTKELNKIGIAFSEEDVLYGKLRPYLHNWLNPDFCGVAVGDWWVLKPQNMDKHFLYRLIQTAQYDEAANQSTGTKMPRADWKLISNLSFKVPKLIEEQSKIGAYFSNIDNLITLHQRKSDSLKEIKKFMLQNMFPNK